MNVRNFHLSKKLMNPSVFGKLSRFTLNGHLKVIETDFFKALDRLRSLDLQLRNLRNFLHSTSNQWMSFLFHLGREYGSKLSMKLDLESIMSDHFLLQIDEFVDL